MNKLSPHKRLTSYDSDFALWTKEQAELLRLGNRDQLDLENLAEEIDSLGRSERHQIDSRLQIVLIHLLKWHYQPGHRSGSWRASIREQRRHIEKILKGSPSLRDYPAMAVPEEYADARLYAAGETGLPETLFPTACPFTIDQILAVDFWPD